MPILEKTDPAALRNFFQGIAKPKLKHFHGERDNYFDWREQFDLFVDQAAVPARHKMVMLKSALSGKPLHLIEKYGYTTTQYDAALSKLEDRYGGKRRLIQRHIHQLMTQPRVQEDDLKSLERFADNLEDAVIGLREQGGESTLEGDSALLSIVLQKTPERIFLRYQDSNPHQENLLSFSHWLSEYVSRRLELRELKELSHYNQNNSGYKKKGQSYQNSTSSAATSKSKARYSKSTPKSNKTSTDTCPLCAKLHQVVVCHKWRNSNVQERWEVAKQNRLCYRCLEGSHMGKFCEKNIQCPVDGCIRNHHKDMHAVAEESHQNQNSNNAFGVTEAGRVQVSKVALRLLPVKIIGSNGKMVIVNAFLDDGSDSSYIR
jgi:hypothetical protein